MCILFFNIRGTKTVCCKNIYFLIIRNENKSYHKISESLKDAVKLHCFQ